MMACMDSVGSVRSVGDKALVTNQRVDEMIMCTLGDNRPWGIGGAGGDGGTPEDDKPEENGLRLSAACIGRKKPRGFKANPEPADPLACAQDVLAR